MKKMVALLALFCVFIAHAAAEVKEWQQVRRMYPREDLNWSVPAKVRIPKIIHQIWLGSPFPEKYRRIQKTWTDHHPDWEYRLWTDEDVAAFGLRNQVLYDRAVNWGQKSDILRYEILDRFGGLYIDTDFECVKPFDILHSLFDFYTGIMRDQPSGPGEKPMINNGLIGSLPGHPILKLCIENMHFERGDHNDHNIHATTGPFFFTEIVLSQFKERTFKNAVFPAVYFYPLPGVKRRGIFGEAERAEWIKPESFAIHYWECSWMKNP